MATGSWPRPGWRRAAPRRRPSARDSGVFVVAFVPAAAAVAFVVGFVVSFFFVAFFLRVTLCLPPLPFQEKVSTKVDLLTPESQEFTTGRID